MRHDPVSSRPFAELLKRSRVAAGLTQKEDDPAKRGFVPLPRRWVVERISAWATRLRPHARDYERLAATLAALHFLAFVCLMLHRFTALTLSP